MVFAKPDQHDFAVQIYSPQWRGPDLCQRLHGVAAHFCDPRHGITGGKHPTQSGCKEKIAGFHVCIAR